MITSQTVGLLKNIDERLHEDVHGELTNGKFVLDTDGLSEKAQDLVDAFMHVMKGLAECYPNNIQYLVLDRPTAD